MATIPRGLFDLIEDRIVETLKAFSDVQQAEDPGNPGIPFDVLQGHSSRVPTSAVKPVVNVYLSGLDPVAAGSTAFVNENVRSQYYIDLTVAPPAGTTTAFDKAAHKRLLYLIEQIKYPLFALVESDFGFATGVITRRPWPTLTWYQTENPNQEQPVGNARWMLSVEYFVEAADLEGFDPLEFLSLKAPLSEVLFKY